MRPPPPLHLLLWGKTPLQRKWEAMSVSHIDDATFRIARIGLRVLRGDSDPRTLPNKIAANLRARTNLLPVDVAERLEAVIGMLPETEVLDLLERNLTEDGQSVNFSSAACELATRPEIIEVVTGGDASTQPPDEKFGAACLALGMCYLALETYLNSIIGEGDAA